MQIAIVIEALVSGVFKGNKFRIVASIVQRPPHFIIAVAHKVVAGLARQALGVLSLHEDTTYFRPD